jgi:hypothetical protein
MFRPQENLQKVVLKQMDVKMFRNQISPMAGNMCQDWIVHYPTDDEAVDDFSLNSAYSLYVISIPAERHPGYYLYNIIAVMFFLGSLGLGVFVLPYQAVQERASLLLTVLLTLIAFKFVASENIPRIQYLTWLDQYILTVFFFQAMMLVFSFYLGYLVKLCGGTNTKIWDNREVLPNGTFSGIKWPSTGRAGYNFFTDCTNVQEDEWQTQDNAFFYFSSVTWVMLHTVLMFFVRARVHFVKEQLQANDAHWEDARAPPPENVTAAPQPHKERKNLL